MGHIHRLQGRLFPYTNTGTVQEISQILFPRSDIPVQGFAFWPLNSIHGIHCGSKGGETNGHSPGYKNPPVPRRRVGESQVPPYLSPAHLDYSEFVPGPGMGSEHREIRAGTKRSLCRLPVRSQFWSGLTNTGPVAELSRKDTGTASTTGLSGPAVHVFDRFVDSHRESSSPRPTPYETYTVASQKQLEGTRITRKGI